MQSKIQVNMCTVHVENFQGWFRCYISPLQFGQGGMWAGVAPLSGHARHLGEPRAGGIIRRHATSANPLQMVAHFSQSSFSSPGAQWLQKDCGSCQDEQECNYFNYIDVTPEGFVQDIQKSIVLVLCFFRISFDAVCDCGSAACAAHCQRRRREVLISWFVEGLVISEFFQKK